MYPFGSFDRVVAVLLVFRIITPLLFKFSCGGGPILNSLRSYYYLASLVLDAMTSSTILRDIREV